MSEHEFEAYLALLGGMLGLSDEQREAISGELRDHMLERMHEQLAAGVPRDEAIQRALAEFGDASRLAAGLAAAATLHRRRLIMRWTFGTVVTFGLLLFIGLAYWPAGENGPGPQVSVGQQQEPEGRSHEDAIPQDAGIVPPQHMLAEIDPTERAYSALQQTVDIDTVASPVTLEQFVKDLARKLGLETDIDMPEDQLKHLATDIDLKLENVPAVTVLNLLMSRIPPISFTIRDGALVLTSADEFHGFVRLYPVGDLLAVQQADTQGVVNPGFELPRLVDERRKLLLTGQADAAEGYDKAIVAAAEMFVTYAQSPTARNPKLVGVLQSVVASNEWDLNGGPCSIQTYGDVLVIYASLPIHWEITRTLARLRRYVLRDGEAAARLPTPHGSSLIAPRATPATIPPYVIEPPDVLLIRELTLIPKSPYKLNPLDVVAVKVGEALDDLDDQIGKAYAIQPDGTIDLGPSFGEVTIFDRTLQEATKAVENHLKRFINTPKVELSLAASSGVEQIRGQYLVAPDGRVNLRSYGQVYVSGKTLVEAKAAIEEKLAEKLEDPEVVVDVFAYNSKVYYVITQGDGRGDNVVRVPITGNETVLDAISNLGGIRRVSSKKIWIARPAAKGVGVSKELPVDWDAITREGVTATNYQVLPGDRIFIADKNPEAQNKPPTPREAIDARY